jgi:autotransporter-associated beta strand protein
VNSALTHDAALSGADGGVTKAGNGTLTLAAANTYNGATTVNAGTLSVTGSVFSSSGVTANAGGTFAAGATQAVRRLTVNAGGLATITASAGGTNATALTVGDGSSATPQLALQAGGKVDINNNGLIVDVAAGGESAALTTVRTAISAAYNGGAWNGAGGLTSSQITSSNRLAVGFGLPGEVPAALTGGGTQFFGAPVDASAVVVQTTVGGDANLDKVVNFDDLLVLAKNYNSANAYWSKGDFTYDGTVNFDDLLVLAKDYNQSMPTEPVPGASAQFEADMAAAFAAVPEPGSLALLGIGVGALLGRRRRRNESRAD